MTPDRPIYVPSPVHPALDYLVLVPRAVVAAPQGGPVYVASSLHPARSFLVYIPADEQDQARAEKAAAGVEGGGGAEKAAEKARVEGAEGAASVAVQEDFRIRTAGAAAGALDAARRPGDDFRNQTFFADARRLRFLLYHNKHWGAPHGGFDPRAAGESQPLKQSTDHLEELATVASVLFEREQYIVKLCGFGVLSLEDSARQEALPIGTVRRSDGKFFTANSADKWSTGKSADTGSIALAGSNLALMTKQARPSDMLDMTNMQVRTDRCVPENVLHLPSRITK